MKKLEWEKKKQDFLTFEKRRELDVEDSKR
jgi:hypothetical protein